MKKHCCILGLLIISLGSCKQDKDGDGPNKKFKTLDGNAPLVIGHRGASGLRPEHTLESYQLAIEQGADFIEPDLVLTKDSVLICRHEPMLSGTTNIASIPQFSSRKTTRMVDGVSYTDWFAGDFFLAEIKTIKAIQAMPERSHEFDGKFSIPTFDEVISLAKAQKESKGRIIGIYPETKHPTFHELARLPINDKLLAALSRAGWNNASAPVYVQSFEVSNLQYIRSKSTVKIVQLFDAYDVAKDGKMIMQAPYAQPYDFVLAGDNRTYNDLSTDAGLDFIKTYANGIGPWKPFIQPYTFTDLNNDNNADDLNKDGAINDADLTQLQPTTLIERAHKRNLVVHAYTFRNESRRLLSNYNGDPRAEYRAFYALGIDGVFSDFPETAVEARR